MTVEPDPEHALRYVVRVTDAAALSDVLCWRMEGFVDEMASRHGPDDLWTWRRTAPDAVCLRMRRDP